MACSHAPAPENDGSKEQVITVESLEKVPSGKMLYFVGQSMKTSPDGRILWGLPRRAAYKRLVVPVKGRIIEYFFAEADDFHTMMLTRVDTSQRFDVREKRGQFFGHLDVDGSPWDWPRWTFELETEDGAQRIVGSGTDVGGRIRVERRVLDREGVEVHRFTDDLKPASKAQFEEVLKDLVGLHRTR